MCFISKLDASWHFSFSSYVNRSWPAGNSVVGQEVHNGQKGEFQKDSIFVSLDHLVRGEVFLARNLEVSGWPSTTQQASELLPAHTLLGHTTYHHSTSAFSNLCIFLTTSDAMRQWQLNSWRLMYICTLFPFETCANSFVWVTKPIHMTSKRNLEMGQYVCECKKENVIAKWNQT